jgi:hypothetical protein
MLQTMTLAIYRFKLGAMKLRLLLLAMVFTNGRAQTNRQALALYGGLYIFRFGA